MKISEGLSETDKEFLKSKEPESKKDDSGKVIMFDEKLGEDGTIEITIEGQVVRVKKITWKDGSEWQCPFCMNHENPKRQQKCKGCSAIRYEYGNMDMVYKTPSGRKAQSSVRERMCDAYNKYYGKPTI